MNRHYKDYVVIYKAKILVTAMLSTLAIHLSAQYPEIVIDDFGQLIGIGAQVRTQFDVAPDGKVYVVQFADGHVGALDPSAPETLAGSVQILHRRTGETMGSIVGLTLPGGIAIDYRDVFISNNSVFPGAGEVVGAKTLCTAQFKTICQMTRP